MDKIEIVQLFAAVAVTAVLTALILCLLLLKYKQKEKNAQQSKQIQQLDQLINKELELFEKNIDIRFYEFQSLLAEKMNQEMSALKDTTAERLAAVEKGVSHSLTEGFDTAGESFGRIIEQVGRLDEAQKNLGQLAGEINQLKMILNDKKMRGLYGETQLYTLLENVLGQNDRLYRRQVKLSSGVIADCVLYGPKALGPLVIDSKFPFENYNRMIDDSLPKTQQDRARSSFRQDVAKHIKAIQEKYIIPKETAPFACMFIPAESVYAAIIGQFDELLQLSFESRVYLVSPTTLTAYLSAFEAFYLEEKRSEQLEEIQQEYKRLHGEMLRFKERWEQISHDFEKVNRDLHPLSVTVDKLLKRFDMLEKGEIENTDSDK